DHVARGLRHHHPERHLAVDGCVVGVERAGAVREAHLALQCAHELVRQRAAVDPLDVRGSRDQRPGHSFECPLPPPPTNPLTFSFTRSATPYGLAAKVLSSTKLRLIDSAICLRCSSPRTSASVSALAWSRVIFGGSGGSFSFTTASITTGPSCASACRSCSPQRPGSSIRTEWMPKPSAIFTKSTGAKSTPYSGLPMNTICSHLIRPSVLFFSTISFTGSWCWTSVARSPSIIVSEPSPVNATTWRLGNAICAPIAYGSAAAIEQFVPLNEKFCPRRSLRRPAQVVTVPESPHRIASSAIASERCQATTCGFIGVSSLVPRSSISAHQSRMPLCACSRKLRSSPRSSSGTSAPSVARASPTSPTSAG